MKFLPCVLNPGKIICIGRNYRAHIAETNAKEPDEPILFSKYTNSLAAHRQDIPVHDFGWKIDYEAELAFVIGKRAKNAQKKDSLNHIFGYFPANDVSARKLQFMSSQWLLGKTLDAFAPIGTYLVTADEVKDPGCLNVQCRVNGPLRQIAPTSDIISFISAFISLYSGDIVLTGTPDGVAPGRKTISGFLTAM